MVRAVLMEGYVCEVMKGRKLGGTLGRNTQGRWWLLALGLCEMRGLLWQVNLRVELNVCLI